MTSRDLLRYVVIGALAIVVGVAAWSISNYAEDGAEPPLEGVTSQTTTSSEATSPSRALPDQETVLNLDEAEECNLFRRTFPNVDLPGWAHAAKSIAGRWLVAEQAVALPFSDPERPQLSVLWHLATPPTDPTDFGAIATASSGEEIEAIEVRRTAPGFFRSTFPLDEMGCWVVQARWGEQEAEIRFLVDLYSTH